VLAHASDAIAGTSSSTCCYVFFSVFLILVLAHASDGIAGVLLPHLLFLLLPPSSLPSNVTNRPGNATSKPALSTAPEKLPRVSASNASTTRMKLIRSGLATLIHTLSATNHEGNYLALAFGTNVLLRDQQQEPQTQQQRPEQQQQQQQQQHPQSRQQQLQQYDQGDGQHQLNAAWLHQCRRLQRLCCLLVRFLVFFLCRVGRIVYMHRI